MFVYTIGDIISAIVVAILIIAWLILEIPGWFKRARCKHKVFQERDMTWNAYCMHCGTNLGFIGTLRKDPTKKEYQ